MLRVKKVALMNKVLEAEQKGYLIKQNIPFIEMETNLINVVVLTH
ncbi:Uncharacterised protein [Proteus vulgaris]|nr:hypothetical protein BN1805_03022 [Proteus vulgaris]SUC00179.1 Uncharacterised protein [Proteus vulgaris]